MKKVLILCLFCLFGTGIASAEKHLEATHQVPILWKLDTTPSSWLFGTIHLPDPRVSTLPAPAKILFDQSDIVLTEITMEQKDTRLIAKMMKRHDEQPLKAIIPEATYQRLTDHLDELSVPIQAFEPMKLWAIYAALPMLPSQQKYPTTTPLDLHIYQQAKLSNKLVGGLETAVEQTLYFDQFTHHEQVTLLEETLDIIDADKHRLTNSIEMMIEWYLQGGQIPIRTFMKQINPVDNDKKLEAKITDILLTQRNQIMAERIVQSLKENPDKSHFIAVGAGHLSDDKNIPYFLEKRGITASKID